MKKILSLLLTLLIAVCLLMGCAKGKRDPDAIGIGGIGPLTGDTSAYGCAVRNGAQIAIDEINALGGIQFELNFMDDVNDGAKSMKCYDALNEWGMHILLGATTTDPCIQVVDAADRDGIFTVTPSASAPEITAGHDNVFRVSYNDMGQGKAAASYIAANALSQRIAVIYKCDDTYSSGVYEAFKKEADRLELEIVSVSTFDGDKKDDFSEELSAASDAGADLLFLPIYYEPASVILTQADEMDFAPLFFGTDGLDGLFSVKDFDRSLAEGVHLLSPIPADFEDEKTRKFMEAYQSAYGERPNQFAADAYDSVYAIFEAVKASGVTADMTAQDMCGKLSTAMTQISIDGITAGNTALTWSADGEVTKNPVVVVIQNGSYVVK